MCILNENRLKKEQRQLYRYEHFDPDRGYPVISLHGHFAPSHFSPTKSHFAP